MTGNRYFEGDYPDLELRLLDHFARTRHSFEEKAWRGSLVLGGGYGRGEGGVMQKSDGVGFSNDLDYFLFDDDPANPELNRWCREIEAAESELLGIDVEIKCLRANSIGDPSRSMMFADLVAGHCVVAGDAGFLKNLSKGLNFSRIEAEEATRLLWNRGSGMYFSRCKMGANGEKTFVIRNHAKLKLALGDAWLCSHGRYTSKCRERNARLQDCDLPPELSEIRKWHAEGVDFKFSPYCDGISWEDLEHESRRLIDAWGRVFLLTEQKRLSRKFDHFADYLSVPRLLPGKHMIQNWMIALRDRLRRGACVLPLGDYPRAGLMRALPCLLGLTSGGIAEAARFLPKPTGNLTDLHTWERTYTQWWSYYS